MGVAAELTKWGQMAAYRRRWGAACLLYRTALLVDGGQSHARRGLAIERRRRDGSLITLRGVIIGTTGRCNASCVHCPTGKAATAANPRTPMPMAVFYRIVDGIADGGMELRGQIAFGLFGDGLLDPFVVDRARYVATRLPDAKLSINTNGAAFNAARHAELLPLVNVVALHCESVDPATYDRLMTPLRAANVFPKIEALLAAFPGKVNVSVPVSTANRAQLAQIQDWFAGRGARSVTFDALSSRCAKDRSVYDSLALSPVRGSCGPDLLDYLVVDCDGTVIACCNDFAREQPIGTIVADDLAGVLASRARAAFRADMAANRHAAISTCQRCYGDLPFTEPVQPDGTNISGVIQPNR